MQAVVGDRLHVHGNAVGQADKTGEIVEGNEFNIQNIFYVMVLSRDFENELFDWKIHEFESNRMLALV